MPPGGIAGGETAWRSWERGVRSVGADARIGPRHTGMCRVVIKRQKPLRPRFTRPPPRCARRLSRGHSPRKKAPHNVGSWPSLRGLRGFAALPLPRHTKKRRPFSQERHFPIQNRSVQKPKKHPRRCAANCHHHNGGKDGRQPLPGQTGMIRRDVGLRLFAMLCRGLFCRGIPFLR